MPDRVKEAIFSILGTRYGCPGLLPPLRVADLFAGSGSLGLEALSRGAATCCFVENDRVALASLQRNLDALRVGSAATIVSHDAWVYCALENKREPFNLVFLDPPYRASEDVTKSGSVWQFLDSLSGDPIQDMLIVLHHPAKVEFPELVADRWRVDDVRTFGSNSITLFKQ